jgi:hypothetical protein
MSAKKKYFTINFIHLIHKACQIVFACTNQFPQLHLHSQCLHFLTLTQNITILFPAIPQHINMSHPLHWYSTLLKTLHVGRVTQFVLWLATGWTVRDLNPSEGEIFRTCPDRPRGPPSLLYNGYWVFPGRKEWPGRDADPSPPSSTVVKKG